MILPAGITAEKFQQALREFEAAVGKEWTLTSQSDLDLYRDAYSPLWGEPSELRPSAAVAPDRVEQVQEIVRIANRYRIAVHPISTGKNLGYGGSAPTVRGAVVIDLKRMNRVLEVDDRRHFAMVEPGVSYYDLYNHIVEKKLRVWIDTPEPGWGSVIGNALERGIGWTVGPYRDHFRSHCGMEVVLASGEVIRTGMGALPNAQTWGQFPYGFGPYVDGLFSQGNFGIVTKMGFWLLPEPETYFTGRVHVPRRRDLIELVDVVTELEHSDMIGVPLYESRLMTHPDPALHALTARAGGPTDDALDNYAKTQGIPAWECTLAFYGPEETVRANWAYAQRRLRAAVPAAQFQEGTLYRFPMAPEQRAKIPFRVAVGAPNLDGFSRGGARTKYNPTPSDGHLFFAPIYPKTGEAALEAARFAVEAYGPAAPAGMNPWFSAPQAWIYRSFLQVIAFSVSRTDVELNRRSREGFLNALKLAAARGYGDYRTSPVFTEVVSNVYSFGDHALRRFGETLKDAADPNGILSPGRGGIWPQHLRKAKE